MKGTLKLFSVVEALNFGNFLLGSEAYGYPCWGNALLDFKKSDGLEGSKPATCALGAHRDAPGKASPGQHIE